MGAPLRRLAEGHPDELSCLRSSPMGGLPFPAPLIDLFFYERRLFSSPISCLRKAAMRWVTVEWMLKNFAILPFAERVGMLSLG